MIAIETRGLCKTFDNGVEVFRPFYVVILSAVILPAVFVEGLNIPLFAALVGVLVPALVMVIAIAVFKRKSL